jgi:orotidine-5'-phosphate decarboxylase
MGSGGGQNEEACLTRIALALNLADPERALEWLGRIGTKVDCYKLQMDLFGRGGPALIRQFVEAGAEVFLDLKFHDIPSVVASAVLAAGDMGAKLLTVHTSGGAKMMAEAAKAAAGFGPDRPRILGVTVLTSLDALELERVTGCRQTVEQRVLALARLARDSGCDGVVCSPQEIGAVKGGCGREFVVVTPGIRMGPAKGKDDQARTLTPAEAARAGADYIVVGRPIYEAADPLTAIAEIRRQLGG